MVNACGAVTNKIGCRAKAETFYVAVKEGGCNSFMNGQKNGCICG